MNNHLRNILIIAALIIVGAMIAIKLSDKVDDNAKKTEMVIGTFSKSLGNVPYYIAKEKKWFENAIGEKYDIKYVEYNDRPSIASALSKSKLNFVFSAEIPAILIQAQGEDVQVVNISTILTQEIIVPKKSDINKMSDLKNKNIAVLAGTSSHYALLKMLSASGIENNDINIVFMQPAEAKIAFETGKIDAWAVWPPWVEQQQATGYAKIIKGSRAIITSVGYMPRSFIISNPEIADTLSHIINKAKKWMINNQEAAKNIAAKQVGLDKKVIDIAWPKFQWDALYDEAILKDMQEKASFLSEENLTRDKRIVDVKKEMINSRVILK